MLRSRLLWSLLTAATLLACGGEEEPPPPPTELVVHALSEGTELAGARVLLLSGDEVVRSGETTDSGVTFTDLDPEALRVRVSLAGYVQSIDRASPLPTVTVVHQQTTSVDVTLYSAFETSGTGSINGHVMLDGNPVAGALVVAESTTYASGYTDETGGFSIGGVAANNYEVSAYVAGHAATPVPGVGVSAGEASEVTIELSASEGASVSGSLIDASGMLPTVTTSIAVVQLPTREIVPGLMTRATLGEGYSLTGLPPGRYRIRAFLEDDGVVVATDLIRQRAPLELTVGEGDSKTLDIPAAPAVDLIGPMGSTSASNVTFQWQALAAANFYVLEVRNARGEVIFGGFDANGEVRSPVLGNSLPFDSETASEPIVAGRAYAFRVHAAIDKVDGTVFELIAASEELEGTFTAE